MYRTWVILRHTFLEATVQPIFTLLLLAGAAIIGIYTALPFFTLGEDVLMFKAVGLDVILLLALLGSLFAASRSIYEEIEDRTMLTLMSKPVSRGQVLVGKFLGLLLSAGVAVAILGALLAACIWLRVPRDYSLPSSSFDETVVQRVGALRAMHLAGLWPQLALLWMQVGVLVAVSVAISTRFSLVVNLPATILLYLAGNLTRFVDVAADGAESAVARAGAYALNTVLPFLSVFDLTQYTVYAPVRIAGTELADDPLGVWRSELWGYVGVAGLYFVAYVAFVLLVGHLSLRTRELGGGEG